MFLTWKTRSYGVVQGRTQTCPHAGITGSLLRPRIVRTVNYRQVLVWYPAPSIRSCCVDNPYARVAWWDDAMGRWWDIRKKKRMRTLFDDRDSWIRKLAERVRAPTDEEREAYRELVESGSFVDLEAKDEVAKVPDLSPFGLAWPCRVEDLTAAWRREALRTHPDRGGSQAEFVRLKGLYESAKTLVTGS